MSHTLPMWKYTGQRIGDTGSKDRHADLPASPRVSHRTLMMGPVAQE
jgi:hypothetical protein